MCLRHLTLKCAWPDDSQVTENAFIRAWLFLSALPYVSPWHDYPGMKEKNLAVECCTLCERVVSFEDFE